ncbi:MAG: hypothetical protein V4632_20205 [Pseudomonadota bacterium]
MTVETSSHTPEIRTFISIEEIRALEGFEDNAPLTRENYKQIFGDYHLPEKARCCVQKENGNLCEEPHNHGWLVRRIDGKLTLVGSDCGVQKFGADRRLLNDLNHYRNEKARRARVEALAEAIAAKTVRINALTNIRQDIKSLDSRIRQVTDQFGPLLQRRLQDMVRTRRYEVVIKATKRREYVEDGQTKYEVNSFQHVLGSLAGLELTTVGAFSTVYDAINNIVRAYQQAENLMTEPDLRRKTKEVNNVAGCLQRFEAVLQDGKRLIELERSFLGNDFFLFCFLTGDKNERVKAAKLTMGRAKAEKLAPAEWLSRREAVIKQQLQADSIAVQ